MNSGLFYIPQFIILVLLQVLIINNIQLGELSYYITPFIYILFILTLPISITSGLLMVIAFFLGLSIDLFEDTLGMHTSATVVLAFLRPYILSILAPRDGFDTSKNPSIYSIDRNRFIAYVFISSLVFHLWFFIIEILRFSSFHITLLKAIISSLIATVLIIVAQYITAKK